MGTPPSKAGKSGAAQVEEREEDLGDLRRGPGSVWGGVLSMIRAWSGSFIVGLDGPFI